MSIKTSIDIENNVVKDYTNGMRVIDISKKYNLDRHTVNSIRKRNGISLHKGKQIIKICEFCGGLFPEFLSHADRRHTCSKKCFGKLQSIKRIGKNNPSYKDGTYVGSLRSTKKWKKLRKQIRDEDNNQCRICHNDNYVVVHHIKNVDDYPELFFDEDNLMTVCQSHHKLLHESIKRMNRGGLNE